MNVGVIKLGSRISFNSKDTSGGNGEARSILKMLKLGGANITIFTKILSKDILVEDYKWVNISDWQTENLNQLDSLVILNGNVNFFGGAEDKEQLLNYEIVNTFKGKVFYILCDPKLTLKQIWKSVEKKPWSSNWSRDQLYIQRNDITYLSQPHDVDKVKELLKTGCILPKEIKHFPFEKFPCLNKKIDFNENPEVYLSYGGTMRSGRRMKKMIKFYFGHPDSISVNMFGKINNEDFDEKLTVGLRHPQFSGAVQYDKMLQEMNKSMCHCVIGDPLYEQINDIPQRLYESIWSNVITFIDNDMDKMRRVWKNDHILGDFLYVSDRQELGEKILLLSSDISTRKQLCQDQFEAIAFNAKEYCNNFVNLIC